MNTNKGGSSPFQIIALSGGGIRGLFCIKVLADLEQDLADESGDPDYSIAQHFDLICGTSVGGLLALGLAYGLNARQLLSIIDQRRKDIFPQYYSLNRFPTRWLYKVMRGCKQALTSLYSQDNLEALLTDIFGDALIGDLKQRVVVPAVNYSTGAMKAFKTPHHPDFKRDWRIKLRDVALATSAAPTYFPIHEINSVWYADGGLVANAPGLVGIHEVKQFLPNVDPNHIRLMAVGTMGTKKTAQQDKRKRQGYLKGWGMGTHLLELAFSANETLHNQIAEHLIGESRCLFVDEEQTPEQSKVLALDNASDSAADILKAHGYDIAQRITNNNKFRELIKHKSLVPVFYYGANQNHDPSKIQEVP